MTHPPIVPVAAEISPWNVPSAASKLPLKVPLVACTSPLKKALPVFASIIKVFSVPSFAIIPSSSIASLLEIDKLPTEISLISPPIVPTISRSGVSAESHLR